MNRDELKEKLDLLGISPRFYSLNGDLSFDTMILYPNYDHWEVFYYDERGDRGKAEKFKSESDACEHLYNIFVYMKKRGINYGPEI